MRRIILEFQPVYKGHQFTQVNFSYFPRVVFIYRFD